MHRYSFEKFQVSAKNLKTNSKLEKSLPLVCKAHLDEAIDV